MSQASRVRLAVCVLLPFAAGYYLSYLFRCINALIADAGRSFADYQRLTAEGRLAEAGQKLEALKQALEQLQQASR